MTPLFPPTPFSPRTGERRGSHVTICVLIPRLLSLPERGEKDEALLQIYFVAVLPLP
jgi:hypothetical protein